MKTSFIIPARNKAQHVAKCIRSVFDQTYDDFELVVSVQPSEDETLAVVRDLMNGYAGPKRVRVLECPDGEYRGMAGLNRHFAFIHQQIDGDIVIMCSADDYNEPERVAETVRAFETFNPSYVGTRVRYETPEGTLIGETGFPGQSSRHVAPQEAIKHMIGSSASSAWSRDLFEKYGPLQGIEAQDMILPMMALYERGLYYIDKVLHRHVFHASADNTGLEGQMRAETDAIEHQRLAELNGFHNVHHWLNIHEKLVAHGHYQRMNRETYDELAARIIGAAHGWAKQREHLTMLRIEPKGMQV